MKKLLTVLSLLSVFVAASVFADSSGNFTAQGLNASCIATPACFFPDSCTSNTQCPKDFTCQSGTCQAAPSVACDASHPCACGLTCVGATADSPGTCQEGACDPNTPCPFGFSCTSSTEPGTCVPPVGAFGGNTLGGGVPTTGQLTANIQTPNGQGTTLLIRPSFDTGLFTASKLTQAINNATADVGILVCVSVDNGNTTVYPITNLQNTIYQAPGPSCVVYDQRIQQVSNTLFGFATACTPTLTATVCTTDANCPAGEFCSAGFCAALNPACNFEILNTTLSAHNWDFVAPVGNGNHLVTVQWGLIGTGSSGGGSTAACVGPAQVTVQQVKNFKNTQTIHFQ